MSAHAKGPWRIDHIDGDWRAPDERDHVIVAPNMVCPGFAWENGDEGKANARLIAAAPDLLAALESMVAMCRCVDGILSVADEDGAVYRRPCPRCTAARAAIKQATGDES